ncbi:MAG: ATP-binding cassette domain-containing protein [Candidatus Coatesbacteria bacterium]|nr:MAG: ATP-binding cassette domain-containing protein [Candidatus Coatesbacteria bacterium]
MAYAFELNDLGFTYRGRPQPALSHITLRLEPGRALGLLGHSGAGKSTLLATLAAVVPAVKKGHLTGEVRVGGRALAGSRPADLAGEVAFVFEDFDAALVATTVEDEVAFGPRYLGVAAAEIGERVREALAQCGLAGLETRRVESLSGGQKQRLAVAAALATDARLLLFDEATTDLDPAGKAAVRHLVAAAAEGGRAAVVADNDGRQVLELEATALLGAGELLAVGPPLEILADEALADRAGVQPLPYLKYFEQVGDRYRLRPGVTVREPAAAGEAPPPPAGGPAAIAAEGVYLKYSGGVTALSGCDFAVQEGDFVALVGENGGGKTTLAKVIAGLLAPTAGNVRVRGEAPTSWSGRRRAQTVGYLFQNPDHQIFQATVRAEVAFGPRQLGLPVREIERRTEAAVVAVGLEGREAEDPFAIPKGDRQRVALASVLSLEPAILVMDEPTTGLDRREVASLMAAVTELNRAGTTVVFITHAMDVVASYARRVAVLAGGRLLGAGEARAVLADADLLARAGLEAPLAARLARELGLPAITGDELSVALGPAAA